MEAKLFPESDALLIFYMSKLLAEERLDAGLPGPKKLKRPNLAINSFIKGKILKNKSKLPNDYGKFMITIIRTGSMIYKTKCIVGQIGQKSVTYHLNGPLHRKDKNCNLAVSEKISTFLAN